MTRLPDMVAELKDGHGMNFVNFLDYDRARAWQASYGGHLFRCDAGDAFWFPRRFTASMVLRHPALRGRQGALNPPVETVEAED
jgi:hypothetical protein